MLPEVGSIGCVACGGSYHILFSVRMFSIKVTTKDAVAISDIVVLDRNWVLAMHRMLSGGIRGSQAVFARNSLYAAMSYVSMLFLLINSP